MRRFVIVEKHRPWLWDEDFIMYHDRDFIIVRARRLKIALDIDDEDLVASKTFYRAFMLFDKKAFISFEKNDLKSIAFDNKMDYYHNGLPYCNNKRIFAPALRAHTDIDVDIEPIMLILNKKRDSLIKSIKTFVKK